MKYLLSAIAILFGGSDLFAQKINSNEVPAAVKNSLETNMHVKDAHWDKEESNYEANFKSHGKEMSVLFDESGTILETEVEIAKNDLPSMAKDLLKKDYSSYKIEEVAKIITKGEITYEVEVEKLEKTFQLIFDIQGKLIKQTEEKEESDEKD